MIGIVIPGVGIPNMKRERVMVVVRMLAHVIVGEVPQHADRLSRDQHHDRNKHDKASRVHRERRDHRHSLSPRLIASAKTIDW